MADMTAIAQQFSASPIATITPITDGAINLSFEVVNEAGEHFILQGMSPIFTPVVLDNLLKVQAPLKAADVCVPTCLPTTSGELHVTNAERWYRCLSYVPGITVHDHMSIESAASAGALVGRFHSALANTGIELDVAIKHFHDTAYYMARLQKIVTHYADSEKDSVLRPVAEEILNRYENLALAVTDLPQRIIHADLKVSNIRFDDAGQALALIDMDTLMHGSVVVEMGDALRSWCGTAGEDSSQQVFDRDIYETTMAAYTEHADEITAEEIAAIPSGIALLTVELASRFIADAYEESYFALLHSRYDSLYEQNKTRAVNQLHFLDAFEKEGLVNH